MSENEGKNTRVQLELLDKTIPLEVDAEFLLPDYRSEIRRLLWVRPNFLPPSRFIGNGKADFSGTVLYEVLYAGPDGGLYRVDSEEEYHFSLPFPESGTDGELSVCVSLCPDTVVSRVAAPRRLTARCRLHARVRAFGEKNLSPALPDSVSGMPETLCRTGEGAWLFAGTPEEVTVEGNLDRAGEEELRVISAGAQLFLPEAVAAEDAVHCRGEVIFSLLCCREGSGEEAPGEPFLLSRRVPFEAEVPLSGAMSGCGANMTGLVREVTATRNDGGFALSAAVLLTPQCQRTEPFYYTEDLYLPGFSARCEQESVKIREPGDCANRHFSVSAEAEAGKIGLSPDARILLSAAEAEVSEVQCEKDRSVVTGEVHCHLIYRADDEYGVCEWAFPFRFASDGDFSGGPAEGFVPVLRVSSEGGRVRADGEVVLALCGEKSGTVSPLLRAEFTPAEPVSRAGLEFFYPEKGETLFSVGRRYGVTVAALAGANGLPADPCAEAVAPAGEKAPGRRCLRIP